MDDTSSSEPKGYKKLGFHKSKEELKLAREERARQRREARGMIVRPHLPRTSIYSKPKGFDSNLPKSQDNAYQERLLKTDKWSVDDRPKDKRTDDMPYHTPPDELKVYFGEDGTLTDHSRDRFYLRTAKGNWWSDPAMADLGVYIWKISNGSFKTMAKVGRFPEQKARGIKEVAQKLAMERGLIDKVDDETYIYVEVDNLGDQMIRTAAEIHRHVRGFLEDGKIKDPKIALALIKGFVDMGLVLQGLPNSRTASVTEHAETDKKLKEDIDEFNRMIKKNFPAAGTEAN